MDKEKLKINPKLLTEEQRTKLEQYELTQTQLRTLQDIADMTQEMLNVMDSQKQEGSQSSQQMGALLTDMRESLAELKKKETPEMPDYAQPVVKAVDKLEKSFNAAISKLRLDPQINVDAPQVNVAPPDVDLKGVEKVLKNEVPKAFKQAIDSIPRPEKPDNSELIEVWEKISDQLNSIETATRMKPQAPTTLKVTNPDGSLVGSTDGLTDAQLRATPVPTKLQGDVSAGNSTTTALAAGATFVGAWEEVEDYANIRMVGETDVSSAANGAVVQWSDNGTNVIRSSFATITAPNFGIYFNSPPQAKYFRIVVTNGASPQTYFNLQTTYSYAPESPVQQLLGSSITDNNLAGLVKSVAWGKRPDGTYAALGAPDLATSGNIDELNEAVTLDLGGQSSGMVQITGTWTATLSFEGTVDDTNWFSISGSIPGSGLLVSSTAANGSFRFNCSGLSKVRVRVSAHTTGIATVNIAASTAAGAVAITTPLPSDTYSALASNTSTSGDNTLVTAGAQKIRLYYVALNADGGNSADVTVTVKLGTNAKYKWSLKAGSGFARNIGAGRRYLEGAVGENLVLTLSAAQIVNYSIEYELIS